jgi:ferredoxin-thioredoxin reductase catalytic subunit
MPAQVLERKQALRSYFEKIVDLLGYKFTPDEELVNDCLDAEVELERRFGAPFCPCQGRTGVRAEDMKIVCPCIPFHREHFDAMKRCWCGLYIHKDVTDPNTLRQIPWSEINHLSSSPQPSPQRGEGEFSQPSPQRGEGEFSQHSLQRGEGEAAKSSPQRGEVELTQSARQRVEGWRVPSPLNGRGEG